MKTVAYIDDRATGVSALLALACDDIVFRKGAMMGGVQQIITGGNGQVQDLTEGQIDSLTKRAEGLATQKGHPRRRRPRDGRPRRPDRPGDQRRTPAPRAWSSSRRSTPTPRRYLNPSTVKEPGKALVVRSGEAGVYGLGQEVEDDEAFKALYGLRGKPIRVDGPTWVDGLVTTLNDPFVSWVLLFVGVFMLILEIKMPGVGLPAITSALAFLLFFWSRYLSGTADQLEILLFLVGLICLGLELFVFPGFGVFGMSGFLLIVVSIVMASHTFIWPTQEYEYRQMAGTLFQVVAVMVGVGVGVALVGKYIPSLPVFNRMVLKPETYNGSELDDPTAKPPIDEGLRVARLPDGRDRPDHHRPQADGQGPVRQAPGRRPGRRLLHRARLPDRGHRRPGDEGDRQADRLMRMLDATVEARPDRRSTRLACSILPDSSSGRWSCWSPRTCCRPAGSLGVLAARLPGTGSSTWGSPTRAALGCATWPPSWSWSRSATWPRSYLMARTPLGPAWPTSAARGPRGRRDRRGSRTSDRLVGLEGRALTTLRPSGMVDFDGRRLDGVAEEGLIPPGSLGPGRPGPVGPPDRPAVARGGRIGPIEPSTIRSPIELRDRMIRPESGRIAGRRA